MSPALEGWRVCDYVWVPHLAHQPGRECRNPRMYVPCLACGTLIEAAPTQETLTFQLESGQEMCAPGDVSPPPELARREVLT